ncbi:MAG: 16S rRNA (cytosine(1402)-N(4))-methyltransferase RsmH [Planctomycetota bacterium]|nr:MAG: 16S rRNA (cytosine(1402)-N(4))-methyltransferase RsmH [Planctomycetota bacterium]
MNDAQAEHLPVLIEAVERLLAPRPGDRILDGTVGLGGHARALTPHIAPGGCYIGLDVDEEMLTVARRRLAETRDVRIELAHANYADFTEVLDRVGCEVVDHMLLDLGVNSAQLDDLSRGFSFDRDGPLDMRFDRHQKRQAVDLINALSEKDLADLFYKHGQETASRRIAKRICQARHERRITTTRELARIVESVFEDGGRSRGRTHPATRVFQALRIAVNAELENLATFLERAAGRLSPGGKLAVISFHSLEDGIVKRFVREGVRSGLFRDLTKRPVVADAAEVRRNPRARSAKLRVAQRVEDA